MDPTQRRTLGRTSVTMTALGLGGASIGELFVRVSEADARGAVDAAWETGVRTFDTAPWYGRGLSELRMGAALRERDRATFTLSTKVGRWLRPASEDGFDTAPWIGGSPNEVVFDYTYDGIHRAVEQSRMRLGITRIDVLHVHDLDHLYFPDPSDLDARFGDLETSGWRALAELREAGIVGAIGAGINDLGLMPRFLDIADPDVFLVAMPYTLLDQAVLDAEFPACEQRGVGVVIGSPFASGILATGPVEGATYAYAPPSPEVAERVERIAAVCGAHGVPLAAAALQFPLGHPIVASVIPGACDASQALRNAQTFAHPIPGALWDELRAEGLIREDAPVPA
jgi:D-threo-aldose 1-dehydrogenase